MRIAMIAVMFFLFVAFLIVSNNDLHLGNPEERETLKNMYSDWFNGFFSNAQQAVGYVVKSEWLPSSDSGSG